MSHLKGIHTTEAVTTDTPIATAFGGILESLGDARGTLLDVDRWESEFESRFAALEEIQIAVNKATVSAHDMNGVYKARLESVREILNKMNTTHHAMRGRVQDVCDDLDRVDFEPKNVKKLIESLRDSFKKLQTTMDECQGDIRKELDELQQRHKKPSTDPVTINEEADWGNVL